MNVALCPSTQVRQPSAATWKSGRPFQCRSSDVVSKMRPVPIHPRTKASWVRIAPRGAEVVPEV